MYIWPFFAREKSLPCLRATTGTMHTTDAPLLSSEIFTLNDQKMDRTIDRLREDREEAESRKTRDEQDRSNRIIIEQSNKKLFGR